MLTLTQLRGFHLFYLPLIALVSFVAMSLAAGARPSQYVLAPVVYLVWANIGLRHLTHSKTITDTDLSNHERSAILSAMAALALFPLCFLLWWYVLTQYITPSWSAVIAAIASQGVAMAFYRCGVI